MTYSLLKSPVAHHVLSELGELSLLSLGLDLIGSFSLGFNGGLDGGSDLDIEDIHLLAESGLGAGEVVLGVDDVVVQSVVQWVVDISWELVVSVWVGMSELVALIRVVSWVRLEVDIGLGTG